MSNIIRTSITTIDESTGEVTDQRTKEKKEWTWSKEKGWYMYPKHQVVMSWHHIPIWSLINDGDIIRLHRLAPCLDKDNALSDGKFAMTPADIANVVKLSAMSTVYTWLKRMDQVEVIKKHNKAFYVNPLYMSTSRYLSPELYLLFRSAIDPHVSDYPKEKFKEIMP